MQSNGLILGLTLLASSSLQAAVKRVLSDRVAIVFPGVMVHQRRCRAIRVSTLSSSLVAVPGPGRVAAAADRGTDDVDLQQNHDCSPILVHEKYLKTFTNVITA